MGDCGHAQSELILFNILLRTASAVAQEYTQEACYSQQLAHNLTYEYHCTVEATALKAEGKKEQIKFEQKESL